jgi:hypothetical protein
MTLALDFVVNVTVQVTPAAVAPPQFNQALIVGLGTVITPTERCRLYSGGISALSQMVTDGFLVTSPEYLAAQAYFSQTPTPFYLWIGVKAGAETILAAVQACRLASTAWYSVYIPSAADSDNQAVAQWIQTASPKAYLFFQTATPAVLTGTADIFTTLKGMNLNRFIGTYITTQTGAAPNNAYFGAALMGVAMGRNTGLAGSYFILPFKAVKSMIAEPITSAQFTTVTGNNGNIYTSFANTYNSVMNGQTGTGEYFDQILGMDMLCADLQYGLTNILYQYPAVTQNDEGQSILLHGANVACQQSVQRGFLSSGIWNGQTVLKLQAGMVVPGYLNQSQSYAQLGSKPAKRAAAPIYCTVILSAGVQSVVIGVNVQE